MSIHVSIPSLPCSCSSMPTKLASTTIPSAPLSSGTHSSFVVSPPPSAQLRWPFIRASPRRSYNGDLALRVRVEASSQQSIGEVRTCRNCKKPFDSSENNPRACRFHTAHFGEPGCLSQPATCGLAALRNLLRHDYLLTNYVNLKEMKLMLGKQKGSLKVFTKEGLWLQLVVVKLVSTGIVVEAKIPLIQDAKQLLIQPMMISKTLRRVQFDGN